MSSPIKTLWMARLLIGLVVFFNIQCATFFLLFPQVYTAGFGVSGAQGEAILRSFALLFIMWNVPYVFALWHPIQNRLALIEAVIMQSIGVMGESLLLWRSPDLSILVKDTILRFIYFDSIGLLALCISFWLVWRTYLGNTHHK